MRKLVRQHPPGAATADHIEERIDDRSPRVTRWSPQLARRGQKRSDQPPLFVGKRTRIGFLFGHSKRSTLRSTIVQVHFLSHLLLFSQLLRLSDIAKLTWQSVDLKERTLTVRIKKTSMPLTIPLHPEFEVWVKRQTRGIGNAPLFPGLTGKGTGGSHGLSGRFKAIMDRAKIVAGIAREGSGAGRRTTTLSFHCLRHPFISALANAGVATDLRERIAGHADAKSHARYTHHEIENMRAAMAKLPSVGGAAK